MRHFHRFFFSVLSLTIALIFVSGCTPATQDPHKISTETANLLTSSMDFNGAKIEVLPVAQKPVENAGDPAFPQVTQLSAPGTISGQSFELNIYTNFQNASDVIGAVMYIPPATEFITVEGSLQPVTGNAEAMRFAALKGISQTQTLYFMHFIITLNWDKSFGGKIPKIEFALQKSDGTVGNYWVWEPEIAPEPGDGGSPVDAGRDGSEPIDAGPDASTDAGYDAGSGCTNDSKKCDDTKIMICQNSIWVIEKDCSLEYPALTCRETIPGQPVCVREAAFFSKVKSNDYRFQPRSSHTSVVFNNRAWVLGGDSGSYSNYYSDSWSTADGIAWQKNYSPSSPYSPGRYGHSSVVFKGKIYILGGSNYMGMYRNDVWSSPDGTTWTEESAGAASLFTARMDHSSVVFPDPGDDNKEKIWVIGGSCSGCGDIWASADGKEWEQKVPPGNAKLQRYSHGSVVYDGKIWVIAGYSTGGTRLNDYVTSTNGTDWSELVTGPFTPRDSFSTLVVGTSLYVLGGNSSTGVLNDVWSYSTADGWANVRNDDAPGGFVKRYGHTTVNLSGGFLLMGGNNLSKYLNDVWTSADGATWTEIRPNGYTGLAPRYMHTGVTLEGQLAVIGGEADYNTVTYSPTTFNSLWLSTDGSNWNQQSSIPVDGLAGHTSVVFKPAGETAERAYAIGGKLQNQQSQQKTNATWSYDTVNGWRTDYDAGIPRFSPRKNLSSTVFMDPSDNQEKMWVIGGCTDDYPCYQNDVWVSENAWSWKNVSDGGTNLIQPPREAHCSLTFDGGMWVIGGTYSEINPPYYNYYFNEVWYSANGRDWQKTADSSNRFPPRSSHSCALHDNKMWVSGGMAIIEDGGYSFGINYNDLWYSSDGTNWSEYCGKTTCEYPGRYSHSMSEADGYLWIFGGMGEGGVLMNDVWKTDGK